MKTKILFGKGRTSFFSGLFGLILFFFPFLFSSLPFLSPEEGAGGGAGTLLAQSTRLWATYYGGSGSEIGFSVATDASGNVYLAGQTTSASSIASGGFQNTFGGGNTDVFLVKFSASGGRLWATYYGGPNDELWENGLATDALGNVYLAGGTFSASGIASGGFQNTFGGISDAFLVKFDGGGNMLWSTYYGGTGYDEGQSITTDASGNVYLTGEIRSASNIASGGFQNTFGGITDAFLVKFSASGGRLWATYYGGAGYEEEFSAAADDLGNVYLAGQTSSSSDIASGGFQNTFGGGSTDAFLVKFDASGNRLWATYYGGTDYDYGMSVATDISGNVYLGGETFSTSGIASGGFQNTFAGGNWDLFLVKFNATGNRLWATYYGGTGDEEGFSIATDASGNIYLPGFTSSTSSIVSGGFQNTFGGTADAFLVKFDGSGSRLCATYYGGSDGDFGWGIATDDFGNVYLAGYTESTSGIASGGFQNIFGGGTADAYLVKFSSCGSNTLTANVVSTNINCNGQCNGTATAAPAGGNSPYTYNWSNTQTTQTATGLCAGNYTVTVIDAASSSITATVIITQPSPLSINTSFTPAACSSASGTATANASGGTPGYTYSWNTSPVQTTATAVSLAAGTYTVSVTDANGCTSTQTVTVVSTGGSTNTNQSASICSGTSYTLPGGTAVSIAGTYNDTLTSVNGCDSVITTNLTVHANPTAAAFSNTTITQGQSVTLTASGGGTYGWSNGANGTPIIVTPLITTIYCVTVTDANNCSDTACVKVITEPIDCSNAGKLYFPNAFSPNGDGENDVLKIHYENPTCIKTFKLVIYDRWGEKVFKTTGPEKAWDGFYKGKVEGTAVFVYYLEATLISGEEIIKKGNISLIK